jgi:enamine deaminase RidA (YjgF/YER057c/UK114 family)
MPGQRDSKFKEIAEQLGYDFDGEIKIGGNYVSLVKHENQIFISGQIPRVGNEVMVVGRVGEAVNLLDAQLAAKICALRALALLYQSLGTLEKVQKILRITVFVQCAHDFTQQSEVSDGASEILYAVLGEAGQHTRTSVGVYQLPKNASVELDLIAVAD